MKQLLEHVSQKADEFAGEPLFRYLRDSRVDAAERLAFVPAAAHFVMTFGDLYRFFLPVAAPADRFEELANVHLAEDSTHWKWFLADLANAGMDPTLRFTDALRFIWSDETMNTRRLSYEICRLTGRQSSIHTLAVVLALEAAGRVTLEALSLVGVELEARSAQRLVYFGPHHVDTERRHTLEDGAVIRSLEAVVLDATARSSVLDTVDAAFRHFSGFADDLFRVSQKGVALRECVHEPSTPALARSV
jgi:hypothetical protein